MLHVEKQNNGAEKLGSEGILWSPSHGSARAGRGLDGLFPGAASTLPPELPCFHTFPIGFMVTMPCCSNTYLGKSSVTLATGVTALGA